MPKLVLSRFAQALFALLVVMVITFCLQNFLGDPINNLVGPETSAADRASLRRSLGLDDALPVRAASYMLQLAQGDLGTSWRQKQPVATLLAQRLPATLELVVVSALLATALGVPLGVLAAIHRRRTWDWLIQAMALIGISIPTFVIGILLIQLFSVRLGILPSFGRGQTVPLGWWSTGLLTRSGWAALALPALTLALYQLAMLVRLVRAQMLEVLNTEHIRFARARGISDRVIHLKLALRVVALPVLAVSGVQFGSLLAFSVVTETLFQWPGLGALLIQSVRFADLPVLSAYLVMVAAIFIVTQLVVDLLSMVLDPRLR